MFGHSTQNHQRRYGEEPGKHRTIEKGGASEQGSGVQGSSFLSLLACLGQGF